MEKFINLFKTQKEIIIFSVHPSRRASRPAHPELVEGLRANGFIFVVWALKSGVNLLEKSRHNVTRSINSIMSATYWEIGRRVVEFEQSGASRAKYGALLVERLATDLTSRFGRGFTKSNIWNMRAFYLSWPREQILQTMS